MEKTFFYAAAAMITVLLATACDISGNFQQRITTSAPVELKFLADGPEKAAYFEAPAANRNLEKYEIWYPERMLTAKQEKFPVIIFCNGTGCKASFYQNIFRHLATWGFIAVGTEETMSGKGKGASDCLDFMIASNNDPQSIFFNKIDLNNAGIAGHSQGGAGAFNGASKFKNSGHFKALFAISGVNRQLAEDSFLQSPYEPSLIRIPVMMTSTSKPDGWDVYWPGSKEPGICNLQSMLENRKEIRSNGNIPVVIAVTSDKNSGHADSLWESEPYLAAWFSYWLKGDKEAGNFFLGNDAELLTNPRWQNVVL